MRKAGVVWAAEEVAMDGADGGALVDTAPVDAIDGGGGVNGLECEGLARAAGVNAVGAEAAPNAGVAGTAALPVDVGVSGI